MRILSIAVLFVAVFAVPSTSAATPGLDVGRATELRLSGRVVDFATGTPLVHAEVTVEITARQLDGVVAGGRGVLSHGQRL